jgi:enamine deaminase RidA (YjgF/YER057c/UK114 family)
MKIEPIHHVPMRPEYRSPFSAAFAIEGGRLIFFSGCCTVPIYHKHPHDPDEERQWLKGDFQEQTERTFLHIKEILDAAGAQMKDVLKLTIFTTQWMAKTFSTRSRGATSAMIIRLPARSSAWLRSRIPAC